MAQRWMKHDDFNHEFPVSPTKGYMYRGRWLVMMETLPDS